jgi:hypothetical protein
LFHVAVDRLQMPFRLMPDQMKKLERAARRRGVSKQQFVEAAVLRELAEHEDSTTREKAERTQSASRKSDTTPSSMGIAERLKQQPMVPTPSDSPTPAPVVVNVGSHTASGGADIIERLANYVLAGQDFERSTRLRTAVGILKDTTTTEEERNVLAARLDEVIATKTQSSTPIGAGNNVVRAGRMVFDKIAGLLNK